jgi:hypothetical protein
VFAGHVQRRLHLGDVIDDAPHRAPPGGDVVGVGVACRGWRAWPATVELQRIAASWADGVLIDTVGEQTDIRWQTSGLDGRIACAQACQGKAHCYSRAKRLYIGIMRMYMWQNTERQLQSRFLMSRVSERGSPCWASPTQNHQSQ